MKINYLVKFRIQVSQMVLPYWIKSEWKQQMLLLWIKTNQITCFSGFVIKTNQNNLVAFVQPPPPLGSSARHIATYVPLLGNKSSWYACVCSMCFCFICLWLSIQFHMKRHTKRDMQASSQTYLVREESNLIKCWQNSINDQILIWPLVQVWPLTCTKDQIRIPSPSWAAGTINGQIQLWNNGKTEMFEPIRIQFGKQMWKKNKRIQISLRTQIFRQKRRIG